MLSVGVVYKCTDVICLYLLTYLYIHVCVCVRVNLIHECVQKLPIVASWCWVFASLVEDAVTHPPPTPTDQSFNQNITDFITASEKSFSLLSLLGN